MTREWRMFMGTWRSYRAMSNGRPVDIQRESHDTALCWPPNSSFISVITADCALGCWLTLTKLRNLTKIFRFPHLFILVLPVTWIQVSPRLRGRKSIKTEDSLVLQILTKLWESHMNYLSLIISWFLKVPEYLFCLVRALSFESTG